MKIILNAKEMSVHERIKAIRKAKGFTQAYMAHQLHMDTANYGRIERGKIHLSIERLTDISKIMNVTVQDLVGESKDLKYELDGANHQHAMRIIIFDIKEELVKIREFITQQHKPKP